MSTGRIHVGRKRPHISWGKHPLALVPLLFLLIWGILFTLHFSQSGHIINVRANGLTQLSNHVPGLIKKSTVLGPTDPNTPVKLLIGLHPRNETNLKSYVDTLSRSRSTTVHRYLTPTQVAAAFAPLSSSQSAIIAYMKQAGFSESETYTHHLLIGFTGTIGEAENAFYVHINNYRAPGGREFYAPASDPGVPIALAAFIQSVTGLDSARIYTHPPIVVPKHASTSNTTSNSNNCMAAQPGPSFSYYIPNQIAAAYNLTGLYNAGFRGEGQTVALYELDNYVPSDISTYTKCYGGSSVPISRIAVNGGAPAAPGEGAIEAELDMELVLSTAPHLAALRVYEAANDSVDALAEWSRIISDAVPIVSTSWGSCESNSFAQALYNQENILFMIAAAQGQSIFAASGDLGSNDCGNTTPTTPSVDDPASQPYVTGVGGTKLTNTAGNAYGSETPWNNGKGNASGGGISSIWNMPAWQAGPGVMSAASSGNPCGASAGNYCREVPDVAVNADPATGYEIFCTAVVSGSSGPCNPNLAWITVGGTSTGAPMWAGMIALANQKSLHDGNFNLGFLNPLLYQVGQNNSSTSYSNDFHDVQQGNTELRYGDRAGKLQRFISGIRSGTACEKPDERALIACKQHRVLCRGKRRGQL